MRPTISFLREVIVSAVSQKVSSIITFLIVAAMCATILLTAGRTVGAAEKVLLSIDSEGTRSIIVRGAAGAGLDSSVLDRLRGVGAISWAGAFSAPVDVRNSGLADGATVAARYVYSTSTEQFGSAAAGQTDSPEGENESAVASQEALDKLGFSDVAGGVSDGQGLSLNIVGVYKTPAYLSFLEPAVYIPHALSDSPRPVGVVVVIVKTPDMVTPVADIVRGLLTAEDPAKVSITTSADLAALRGLVSGQLGSFGQGLVGSLLAAMALLVSIVLLGLVTLRRKDFGRRRALGASQGYVFALVTGQVVLISLIGAALGDLVAFVSLLSSGDPLPSPQYFVSIAVLAVASGAVGGIIPSVLAATRDPLAELRVP
jgi:putative ABC transport system permease protein